MLIRVNCALETVKILSNLIIRSADSEYIEFDYMDNVLSWLALEDCLKRKGMLLFSSLETHLFPLLVLSMVSWTSTLVCIFGGTGTFNLIHTADSLFSDSALAVWAYLALLSMYHVVRMLWYGYSFHKESAKQDKGMNVREYVL